MRSNSPIFLRSLLNFEKVSTNLYSQKWSATVKRPSGWHDIACIAEKCNFSGHISFLKQTLAWELQFRVGTNMMGQNATRGPSISCKGDSTPLLLLHMRCKSFDSGRRAAVKMVPDRERARRRPEGRCSGRSKWRRTVRRCRWLRRWEFLSNLLLGRKVGCKLGGSNAAPPSAGRAKVEMEEEDDLGDDTIKAART